MRCFAFTCVIQNIATKYKTFHETSSLLRAMAKCGAASGCSTKHLVLFPHFLIMKNTFCNKLIQPKSGLICTQKQAWPTMQLSRR